MASATFDPALGGDGSTVTDDADPNTGLANGGHRTRFVPALAQTVVMASTAKNMASEAAADRQQTGEDRQQTQADRQQTGEDRVATGNDRTATAEDRQQTGEDRVATGEDRTATEQARDAAENLYGDLQAVEDAAATSTTKASEASASATAAADSEQIATEQTALASSAAAAAGTSKTAAGEYATAAQQARDAALLSTAIYNDTAAGLAGTSDGDYFSTPSADNDEYLILYINNSGSAVEQARYPSKLALETLATEVMQLLQQVVATNDLAAQTSRQIEARVPFGTLDYLISMLGHLNSLVGVTARMVSGGEIELRDGSAALPAMAHHGDRDTGLYFPAPDAIALAVAGLEALRVDPNGRLGIGTTAPSGLLDVDDDRLRLRRSRTPATATDSGNQGDIAWDADYLYVCTATNTWKRVALASW